MMPLKDLQRMLNGAQLKGIYTVYEFIKYCTANNLRTNAQRLEHFTK